MSVISRCLLIGVFLSYPFSLFAESVFDEIEPVSDQTLERSVVMIRAIQQEFDYVTPWKQNSMGQGVGSGFVIEGNRILTNAHNVSNVKYVEIKKQNFAKRYPAVVEYVGHDCDLAVLQVSDPSFYSDMVPLELGGIPQVNSTVMTYGFPMGGRQVSVTKGVVSRIEVDAYSHSRADSHLVIQTDAAINPGNSGGPVLQDNKVVGVAFQGLTIADNIGYMIPTTVIQHFLDDIKDGQYDGFGSLGFSFFPGLHNPAYAEYLQVPKGKEGVVVLHIMMNASLESIVQPEDVITKIGDYSIDNDGMIRIHGLKLHLSEAVEQKQIGDLLELVFYRNGKEMTATGTVAQNKPVLAYWREFDKQPRYCVFAGLTFVPVNRNFLETWGRAWHKDMPFYLRYLFADSEYLNKDKERKEYVVLSEILPDEVNTYANDFLYSVVDTINGKQIMKLKDIPDALNQNNEKYCVLTFLDKNKQLVLETDKVIQRNEIIMEKYQVPTPWVLEDK